MDALILLTSAVYLCCLVFSFFIIKKKCVQFTPFFISIEYFYFFGLAVFPILLAFDVVSIPNSFSRYSSLDDISILTPLHLLIYSLGMVLGVTSKHIIKLSANRLIIFSKTMYVKPELLFYVLVCMAIGSFLFFIFSFGFNDFISTSSLRRSGSLENSSISGVAFLTRFMILGLFVVAIYPYFVINNKKIINVTVFIYIVGVCAYLSTVSRYALFQTFVLTAMIYFVYNKKYIIAKLYFILILLVGVIVLFFGKSIVFYVNMLTSGQDIELITETGGFDKFILNFSHLYFSIDAGIYSFFNSGPVFPKDVLLSPLAVVPSSFFEFIGLESLSYQFVDRGLRSSCMNSSNLGVNGGCFIPPYFTGVSAYLFPLVGAFFFGFVRFAIFASVADAYTQLQEGGSRYIHILLIAFMSLEQIMLFIPSTISLVFFLWLIIILFVWFKRLIKPL